MSTVISISVIIPTRNRRNQLTELIHALSTQSLPAQFWEVIIVNNASEDETQELLENWKSLLPNLTVVEEFRVGSNFARNRGLKETIGHLIAFLDDDTVPHPQWLERIHHRYSALNPMTDCLGGRVALNLPDPLPRWYGSFLENYLSSTHPSNFFTSVSARSLCSANLVIPAALLKTVGGFDERQNRKSTNLRSNDETLTLLQLESSGARFFYDPTIKVFHLIGPDRMKSSYFRRRAWWQGRSDSEMEYYFHGKKLLWKNVIWPSLHGLVTQPRLIFFAFRPCRGPRKFALALQGQLYLGRIIGGFLQLARNHNKSAPKLSSS